MNLRDYIQGNRYGKEAYQLEKEAMRDPFLQDAIDGYDRVNDRPDYYLKKMEKQLSGRKIKGFLSLQEWGIAAAILLIIGLSILYFFNSRVYSVKEITILENHKDEIISNYSKDTVLVVKQKQTFDTTTIYRNPANPAIAITATTTLTNPTTNSNNMNSVETINKSIIGLLTKNVLLAQQTQQVLQAQQEEKNRNSVETINKSIGLLTKNVLLAQQEARRKRFEEYQRRMQQDSSDDESQSRYTLSNSETQALLNGNGTHQTDPARKLTNDNETQTVTSDVQQKEIDKTTDNLSQVPKPANGDQAYNSYVEKNRKQLEDNQHGKVILMFHVNGFGRPVSISVLHSLSPEADREAVRLLQSGPDWTAGDPTARLEVAF